MGYAATATPIWLTLLVAVLSPVASVTVAVLTVLVSGRRERAKLLEEKREGSREQTRQAYVEFLCTLEELLHITSIETRNGSRHPDLEGLRCSLVKGRSRIRLAGHEVLRDLSEELLAYVFEAVELRQEIRDQEDWIEECPEGELRTSLRAVHDELKKLASFWCAKYLELVIKAVTEAMRYELNVDYLLDPASVRPISFTKALVGSVQLSKVKHPITSLRVARRYVIEKRHPRLQSLEQSVRELRALHGEAPDRSGLDEMTKRLRSMSARLLQNADA